jgi:nucleoside-diphosphate-sugar epimerase
MRTLVTGATGFLGSRLVPALLAQGHAVFALARSPAASANIQRLGALAVTGDLDSRSPLELPSIDVVVHAAAYFRLAGPRRPYFRTNVDGTHALLAAASKAGVSRFIYISAAAVVMDDKGSPLRNVDETAPTFPNSFSAYIASKSQGEAAVLKANTGSFATLALRPPGIWGQGDPFSKALPAMIRRRQFAFIGGGRYPYVTCHVDNVVEAISFAIQRGEGGSAYFVNDPEPTTFRDFVSGIAQAHGLSVERAPSIPYALAFAAGRIMELGAALTTSKADPPMSRSMVRLIGREFVTLDTRARNQLGYVGHVSRAEGLRTYLLGASAFPSPQT